MNFVKVTLLVALVFSALLLSGCYAGIGVMQHSPVTGLLYTDAKGPVVTGPATAALKIGTAKSTSILGLVATGDASIDAAMKAGGISKVHHVDYHVMQVLGLYAEYMVTVYGE